ncbi:oligosaccharide flippase family protein [Akkermansiaceae bacterium]|nr:oligosaccharide flippase family protein [Akkermansiaceae bacterium]
MKIFLLGTFWLSLGKISNQLLSLVCFVVLARFLDPSEFGKAALLFVYLTISHAFLRALEFNWIQHRDQKIHDLSTALIIVLGCSCCLSSLMFLIFSVCSFYSFLNFAVYDLFDFTICFSLVLFCPLMILKGELAKKNKFKQISLYNFVSTGVGNSLTPVLLVLIFLPTYKFLFLGLIVAQIIELMLLTKSLRHDLILRIPAFAEIQRITKILFTDYKKFTSNTFITKVALNGDYLVINSHLDGRSLGLYHKAYDLISKPLSLLGDSVQKVIISQKQLVDDQQKLVEYIKQISTLNCIFILPITLFTYIFSPKYMTLILGDSWSEIGKLVSVMAFLIFFTLNRKFFNSILLLKRQQTTLIRINILYAILILIFSWMLVDYGLIIIGVGITATVAIICGVSLSCLLRISDIRFPTVAQAIVSPLMMIIAFLAIETSLRFFLGKASLTYSLTSFFIVYIMFLFSEIYFPTISPFLKSLAAKDE